MNNSEVLGIIDQKLDSINVGDYLEAYTFKNGYSIKKQTDVKYEFKNMDSGKTYILTKEDLISHLNKETITNVDSYSPGYKNLWSFPGEHIRAEYRSDFHKIPLVDTIIPDDVCALCQETLNKGFLCKITNSGCIHEFHCRCLNKYVRYFRQNGNGYLFKCPICRKEAYGIRHIRHVTRPNDVIQLSRKSGFGKNKLYKLQRDLKILNELRLTWKG